MTSLGHEQMPPPKYQREIEEILSKLDDGPPPRRVQTVLEPLPQVVRPPRWRPRPTASGLMIACLVLSILSYPLQWIYPPAVAIVGLVAVGLLLASLGVSLMRWGQSRPARTWRGREISERPSAFDGLRRRWRRWRAHRRFRDTRWN